MRDRRSQLIKTGRDIIWTVIKRRGSLQLINEAELFLSLFSPSFFHDYTVLKNDIMWEREGREEKLLKIQGFGMAVQVTAPYII